MRWSSIRWIGSSRLVRQSYIWMFLVPITAKIMVSARLDGLVVLVENFPLSWLALYLSSIFFALGTTVYLCCCPKIIQSYRDPSDFISQGGTFDRLNYYLSRDLDDNSLALESGFELCSEETTADDIGNGNTVAIEISKKDKIFNIKDEKFFDTFWLIYDHCDRLKKASLCVSFIFFLCGFLALGYIFIDNAISVLLVMYDD